MLTFANGCRIAVTITSLAVGQALAETNLVYPETRVVAQADEQFGVVVTDPYRWLENDVRQDRHVRAWVEAQNAVSAAYLAQLPRRAQIETRLRELWDFEKFSVPVKRGGRYFYLHNDGLQNQSALYMQETFVGAARLLIDPNRWSTDGATALGEWSVSPDGRRVAYTIQDGGSDWRTLRVLDVDSGQVLADEVKWMKFSEPGWAADGSGFYYSRFPEPAPGQEFQSLNLNHTIYFHRIGTPQTADTLIYATPDRPMLLHNVEVTDEGRHLFILSAQGTDNRFEVTLLDLTDPAAKPRTFIPGFDHSYALAGSKGDTLFVVTDRDAPRYRLVTIDATRLAPAELREVVPTQTALLTSGTIVGDKLVIRYLEDAKSVVRIFGLDGVYTGAVALPGIGSVDGFDGTHRDPETFYSYSSFNAPPSLYRYDATTGASTVFKQPKTPFDASDYEVAQVFFVSRDGTKVPMFIAQKRGLDLSNGAPTLLYGYGGFDISLPPSFGITSLAWMEMGGVYAVANIRGGGEYGNEWHDAGRLLHKQNVFDDFIAAAEYLVHEGITRPEKLAIFGGSNGGLLVGAVVNQRPALFAAALPAVGVMDMLRYDRFTAGRYWVDDYGPPGEVAHFHNLYAYSPYHNIRGGADYPAILVTTADTDDRVVPAHSFKYAAALQAANIGSKPHLIRIETRAGHGAGKPTNKIIEEYADMWAFIAEFTGMGMNKKFMGTNAGNSER